MPRTRLPVIAHLTPPASETSPLAPVLAAITEEVLRFEDPGSCLEQIPPHEPVIFLVERSALTRGGLMWLILLSEAQRGPVVLIDDDDHEPDAALRAGVQRVVRACDVMAARDLEALLLECFALFERRSPPEISAYPAFDDSTVRRYVRDSVNEFRTPLTAIVEFASILVEGIGGDLTEKQHEYVSFVLEASNELEQQFDDFRTSLEMQLDEPPPARDRFGLLYAIEEALMHLDTGRVTFRLDVPDDGLRVVGDRAGLVRVIARLAKRAAKRSPRGSEVVVRVTVVAGTRVEVAFMDDGLTPAQADITLLEAGLLESNGLSKSVAQVFGLGVELARSILNQQGVVLELRARDEGGSAIAFSLPLVNDHTRR